MKRYKAIFMKLGSAIIQAESEEKAFKLAEKLEDTDIQWVSESAERKNVQRIVLIEEEKES